MWCSGIFRSLIISVTVFQFVSSNSTFESKAKCCKTNEWIVSENQKLFCNKSQQNRLLLSDSQKHNSTECVEAYNSKVYLFGNQENSFVLKEVFPAVSKCCPPNFYYNHVHHSCAFMPNKTKTLNESFIKIGLSHCNVISDFQFDSTHDFKIANGVLFLPNVTQNFPEYDFCVDDNVDGRFAVRVCRDIGVCENIKCVRKCCPDGQSFVNGSHCLDTFQHGLRFENFSDFMEDFSDDFAIIHGYPATNRVHMVPKPPQFPKGQKSHNNPYCIEHATKNNSTYGHLYFGLIVASSPPMPTKYLLNRAAMILSGIFLVLTMIFYVGTKEIRKVFGKALVSLCLSLLALYIMLVYYTFTSDLHHKKNIVKCKVIGFLIIYLGFCCFVWLQIISYDIYWTFGSIKNVSSNDERKRKAFKRFIFYSLYGWGLPMAITAFSIFFHYFNVLPAPIEIKMGRRRCAIERSDGNYAEILFRTIPLTAILMVNIVLYVQTVKYCLKVKNEIKNMNENALNIKKKKKFFARRERFQLVVKLSLTMGMLYVFEVASSFVDFSANTITSTIEIIWDFINCLQGLFIFLIFVCKKKNILTCKKSATFEKIRKISLSSTRTTIASSGTTKSNINSKIKMETEQHKEENP
ncbi:unnamed protein product [Phaedon cochleariae]|uniref:G-protein coupled receptors family 2 profile 2 domain-containing protein n=1 Tax=Phaedon cochleariae TaxID=80249 RepID=A0A9P0GQ29_PHACE|nr:unnamed protein product [Phaedon cochleariae]